MNDALSLKNQLCFPIYALAKEVVNQYRPLLDALDVTYPQYLVLMVLWDDKEQTVGQLGEKLFLDSGTLTPLLKRMEQKEMVVRKRSTEDERIVKLSLTPKGAALKEKAKNIPHQMMQSIGISEDELKTLKELTTKILNRKK